jgi:tetratricopeptide (TPR) repeat protein
VQELTEWKENEAEFKSRLRVIALNVDGLDQASDPVDATLSKVAAAWKQIGLSFECGTIDPPSFELLEVIERTLLMQQSPLPIPTSFLLDANGELAIVYKGPVSARRLMTDVVAIESSVVDVRDLSASFPGKWYSSPFPPDLLAIPSQLVRLGRAEEAYEYIINNIVPDTSADPWEQLGTTETTLLNVLHNTAQILLLQKKTDEAAVLYRMAIKFVPGSWETHALLSNVLIQSQHSAEALALNRNMARMRPRHPMPQNNIVWILATSDDVQIRDPAKAVELAKQLCNATNMSEPSTLDTLAVAYAANGELEMAIQTGEQAIEAAARLERSDLVNRIQRRVDDLQAELVRQNSADSLDE